MKDFKPAGVVVWPLIGVVLETVETVGIEGGVFSSGVVLENVTVLGVVVVKEVTRVVVVILLRISSGLGGGFHWNSQTQT